MRNVKHVYVLVFILILFCLTIVTYIEYKQNANRCPHPPAIFSESDLVGTWVAGVPKQREVLVIRADGTYKQSIHIDHTETPDVDYEGSWQPWYIEYSEDKIPYIHLTGFAFCGMNPGISCEKRDGSGYDFCQDKSIQMNNEGILLVLGVSKEIGQEPGVDLPLRGINLFYPLGSQGNWIYTLQKP